jgi:hypothetical protein
MNIRIFGLLLLLSGSCALAQVSPSDSARSLARTSFGTTQSQDSHFGDGKFSVAVGAGLAMPYRYQGLFFGAIAPTIAIEPRVRLSRRLTLALHGEYTFITEYKVISNRLVKTQAMPSLSLLADYHFVNAKASPFIGFGPGIFSRGTGLVQNDPQNANYEYKLGLSPGLNLRGGISLKRLALVLDINLLWEHTNPKHDFYNSVFSSTTEAAWAGRDFTSLKVYYRLL